MTIVRKHGRSRKMIAAPQVSLDGFIQAPDAGEDEWVDSWADAIKVVPTIHDSRERLVATHCADHPECRRAPSSKGPAGEEQRRRRRCNSRRRPPERGAAGKRFLAASPNDARSISFRQSRSRRAD